MEIRLKVNHQLFLELQPLRLGMFLSSNKFGNTALYIYRNSETKLAHLHLWQPPSHWLSKSTAPADSPTRELCDERWYCHLRRTFFLICMPFLISFLTFLSNYGPWDCRVWDVLRIDFWSYLLFNNVNRNAMTSEAVKSTLSYGIRLQKNCIIVCWKRKIQYQFWFSYPIFKMYLLAVMHIWKTK